MTVRRPVVIALDAFKGSLGAADAVAAVAAGWRSVRSDDIRLIPMADGGEGTLDAFAEAVPGATPVAVSVTGPDGRPVEASWLLLPPTPDAARGTAVVELANTSGLGLLGTPPRLRPLDAHTRGFGEAIAHALGYGVSRLVLGIGSSASTDGGTGMLAALGARFLDADGIEVVPGGRGMDTLTTADLSALAALPPGGVTVLADVTSPLLGTSGAAAVFGPQKGASPAEVERLDRGLACVAAALRVDPSMPGAGAAGGAGYGLLAWGATLVSGSSAVAGLVGLPDAIAAASVVITGEGAFDRQSTAGKVPGYVAGLAAESATPVALVAGRIAPDAATGAFAAAVSLSELAGSSEAAMGDPRRWLRTAGAGLARSLG